MAQHDYNLSNNTGALYRGDNNAALQAIVTQNSGATAPAVTFPGMLWLDLSGGGNGVMRRRNQANDAWLTDIGQDQVARDAAAAAQATANAAMPKAGGTFTGPINLPGTVPVNNQAVSRAQADVLYQVSLPATVAGAMLVGAAGGWTSVLAPAANDTILGLSGGLPTWTSTTTVAAPNQVVRTKGDGTIDPSLIPSVATGLRFRGTFRPAVNAEYPVTGGSGAGGVPAVGDFWVIDGLTTGGYTYLTGSLAGVTVYNGDSIALSTGAQWYRMGSSVDIEGVIKADGSVAMAADFNMGTHNITQIGGLIARPGTPAPFQGFQLDATNVIVSPQRGTTGPDLAAMATGQLGTDLGRQQIYVGASGTNVGLLPVTWHSETAAYAAGDYVRSGGRLFRAPQANAAGAFVPAQWSMLLDAGGGWTVSGATTFGASMVVNAGITAASALITGTMNANAVLGNSATFAGLMTAGEVKATGGGFVGHATSVVIGPSTNGVIYLRPNGIASAASQWSVSSTDGVWRGQYPVESPAFQSSNNSAILAAIGPGTVYLRPNGTNTATGEVRVGSDGNINLSGSIMIDATGGGEKDIMWTLPGGRRIYLYSGPTEIFGLFDSSTGSRFVSTPTGFTANGVVVSTVGQFTSSGSNVVFASGTSGGIFLRPQGGGSNTGQAVIQADGSAQFSGTVSAPNIPGSDARLKENVEPMTPRAFDSLAFHTFNFIGNPEKYAGIIAQEVEPLAPEYIHQFTPAVAVDDLSELADMVAPPLMMSVDYAGLALEVALNCLHRVMALEAATTPPPEE